MRPQIGQFLQYLRVERGASPHTLKGYREDLHALAEYLADGDGTVPAPGSITTGELRGFLSALHEAGYAKTSISRRLASVRSFMRFGQREGWAKSNPAKALRNPRKSRKLPHFLSTDEIGKLLAAPQGRDAGGDSRPGDSRNAVLGRPARERAGRPDRRRPRFRGRHRARSRQGHARSGCRRSARTPPAH